MPIAAMSFAVMPAFSIASRQTVTVEVQMSSGSCSTQPEAGKCCGNSCCARARRSRCRCETRWRARRWCPDRWRGRKTWKLTLAFPEGSLCRAKGSGLRRKVKVGASYTPGGGGSDMSEAERNRGGCRNSPLRRTRRVRELDPTPPCSFARSHPQPAPETRTAGAKMVHAVPGNTGRHDLYIVSVRRLRRDRIRRLLSAAVAPIPGPAAGAREPGILWLWPAGAFAVAARRRARNLSVSGSGVRNRASGCRWASSSIFCCWRSSNTSFCSCSAAAGTDRHSDDRFPAPAAVADRDLVFRIPQHQPAGRPD